MTTKVTTPLSPAKEIAPFLKNLRRMLDNEPPAVLRWTADGCAFEIHDLAKMATHVLPVYFKHAKYSSFQRQLNYFSFRKWTRSRTPVCTFSNPFFQRDAPDLAWQIRRKKSVPLATKHQPTKPKMTIDVPPATADGDGGLLSPTDAVAMVTSASVFTQQQQQYEHLHYDMNAAPSASVDTPSLEWIDALYPSLEALSQLHDGPVCYDLEPPQMLLQL